MSNTLVFTTSESTSRTQTQTFTVPNFKIGSNVTVNTGTAVVTAVNGNQVTVNFTNGAVSRTATGGSYTPADSKPGGTGRTMTGISPSFPGSISFSSGGYSGTLYKSGSAYRQGGYPVGYPEQQEWYQHYEGTITKPAVDNTYTIYYYKYTATFEVNNSPTAVIVVNGRQISLNEVILNYAKVDVPFKLTVNDLDVVDTLEYSVWLNNAEKKTWASISRNMETNYTVSFSDMLTGNNVVIVKVRDNNGGLSQTTFVLRTLSPNSYCQADVYTLMTALGYGVVSPSSLQSLKPSGYNKTTISLAELVNHLT